VTVNGREELWGWSIERFSMGKSINSSARAVKGVDFISDPSIAQVEGLVLSSIFSGECGFLDGEPGWRDFSGRFRNSPQKRHLIASLWMVSAQKGHIFVFVLAFCIYMYIGKYGPIRVIESEVWV